MDYQDKIRAAREMIVSLCRSRGMRGAREWIMSIPARPDYDPDLVIGGALRAAVGRIAQLEAENKRLWSVLNDLAGEEVLGQVGEYKSEMMQLRADLARVTAERDGARDMEVEE